MSASILWLKKINVYKLLFLMEEGRTSGKAFFVVEIDNFTSLTYLHRLFYKFYH